MSDIESHSVPQLDIACDDGEMTPEQREESKAYGRRELACTLLDMAIDVLYLSGIAFFAAVALDRWLSRWPLLQNDWLRLAALYLVTTGCHYGISFPLSCYSGFLLEHQYGLSRQRFARWLGRYLLQNLLVVAFGLLMVVGLFAIIWWTGPFWWLVAAAASFVVTILLGQFVPVWILPLFYKIERLDNEDLAQRFERLARHTSLHLEGVYRMELSSETSKANAMLAGMGRTRRVLLGDTLLNDFTPDEIEVVLAHEVGHHVFHHIRKLILVGVIYSAVSFFLCDRLMRIWVTAEQGSFEYARVPVSALPLLLLVVTVFSLILSPLRNVVSRRFENQCDRYALRVTNKREAYRTAFAKLARLNKADPDPHPLEVMLFHDHPPIAARLALAEEESVAP